uniref:Uncharacterized protein n=1 Tax=Escherichia coli TaxID=562 RepID=H9AY16_ECOLX|nr:hypothetical protein ec14_43 [Escherichia coli]
MFYQLQCNCGILDFRECRIVTCVVHSLIKMHCQRETFCIQYIFTDLALLEFEQQFLSFVFDFSDSFHFFSRPCGLLEPGREPFPTNKFIIPSYDGDNIFFSLLCKD